MTSYIENSDGPPGIINRLSAPLQKRKRFDYKPRNDDISTRGEHGAIIAEFGKGSSSAAKHKAKLWRGTLIIHI